MVADGFAKCFMVLGLNAGKEKWEPDYDDGDGR
jgi:hypothetical protein